MAKAARKTTITREQPAEDTYVARLLGITDLGHQPGFSHAGKDYESEWKFEFTYELIGTEMEDGRPFVVSEEVANKDSENVQSGMVSKLVARCKSLLGVRDYKEGLQDLERLLGCACMVNVTYNKNGYAQIKGTAAVGSIPNGMVVGALHNEVYFFDMDEPEMDLWEKMPDFKREKIQNALNFNDTELAKTLAEGDQY